MARFLRFLKALILIPFTPILVAIPFAVVAFWDLIRPLRGKQVRKDTRPATQSASVVIPNWNGKDLLAAYLPSVIEATKDDPRNEVIVVENGSTDGSAAFVKTNFPQVRLIELTENLGFGGGSNTGFRAAKNDVVVLLNSDMRVDPGFLAPLLAGFTDESVFAVSCQIYFSDPAKKREETGLTVGEWRHGHLRVRHELDPDIQDLFPCYYGGGGSCAFDRRKFLELGGFDELLAPFYLEDTDLGHMAWKRGWKVLYQPKSIVFHEHRGTIGKHFTSRHIQKILEKNFLLYTWKNIHDWGMLAGHFGYLWSDLVISLLAGYSIERATLGGLFRALKQLPELCRSRARAQHLAGVSDREVFLRHHGAHFRDRFLPIAATTDERISVLFVAPYPVFPPTHGGGVFMYQTICELAKLVDLHLIVILDWDWELEAHQSLHSLVKSAHFLVRPPAKQKRLGSIIPHAVYEFENTDLAWLIHKLVLMRRVDVLQLEYLVMGQYGLHFTRLLSVLFEHDVYFQSIGRGFPFVTNPFEKMQYAWEYLRAFRYETKLLPRIERIQVCSSDNRMELESFLPELRGRVDDGFRAGVDVSRYDFHADGREPGTVLFMGSFRHRPNVEALDWFIRLAWPKVLELRPDARLLLVGSDPPPAHSISPEWKNVELVGFVKDVRDPLARYQVLVSPILSGSGVRVKLLEAFAAGIPVVSTRLGAEGLTNEDDRICGLADEPGVFAKWVVRILDESDTAVRLSNAARQYVEHHRDIRRMTEAMVTGYRNALASREQPTSREL